MLIFFTQLYWMVIALGGYLPYLVKKTIKHAVFIQGPFTLRTSVNACINNDGPVNTTSNAPQNLDVTPSWSGVTVLTLILNVNKSLSTFHTVFTSTQSMGLFANKNACNFFCSCYNIKQFFSKFDKVIGLLQELATTENICYFTTFDAISSYLLTMVPGIFQDQSCSWLEAKTKRKQ